MTRCRAHRQEARLAGRRLLAVLVVLACAQATPALVPVEQTGRVSVVANPANPRRVWVGDPVARRSALVDLDTGRLLGTVPGGMGISAPLLPRTRSELYMPATYYSRGSYGKRTDVLAIYGASSLRSIGEVLLPPKRANFGFDSGAAALSDDDRFAAIFNLTPATSLSIVDVETRKLTGEIPTPGCSLAYSAGARHFLSLCANGSLLDVRLDEAGRKQALRRSKPFFDPESDPVMEKGVRWRNQWLFVSFEGIVHPIDVAGPTSRFLPTWSLLSKEDREDSWRVGGLKNLAVHERSGRLYSLVHQGGPDTQKASGSEIWVYDLATHKRIQRIQVVSAGLTYMALPMEFGERWPWPLNRLVRWLISSIPTGAGEVQVTQDEQPLLVTTANVSGGLAVYDAQSGDFMRRIYTGNYSNMSLQVTSGWTGAAP